MTIKAISSANYNEKESLIPDTQKYFFPQGQRNIFTIENQVAL